MLKFILIIICFFSVPAYADVTLDYMEYSTDASAQTAYPGSYGAKLPTYWSKLESNSDITSPQTGPAGTLIGTPTYSTCKFDNGVYINANNEGYKFQNIGTTIAMNKGTVGCWLKTDYNVTNGAPSDGARHFILDYWINANNRIILYFYLDAIKLIRKVGGSDVILADTTSDWSAGDVVHLAVVWDKDAGFDGAKTMALYVNGIQSASLTTALPACADSEDAYVHIGIQENGTYPTDGVIDNLKIYDYCKTAFTDKDTETSSQYHTHSVNIASADTWQTESWDISSIADANKDAINRIAFRITNEYADNTFYLDNMFGVFGEEEELGQIIYIHH